MTPAAALPLPISRPSLVLLGTEPWRAACEYLSHKLSRKVTASGDGHPVIIFPGLASDGAAVAPLRDHCRALGYNSFDWGRGYNTGPRGDVDPWLTELAKHVHEQVDRLGDKATLVGWSLGGLYAREIAKLLPGKVRQVITIGTPFNADADHTNVGWLLKLLSGNSLAIDPVFSARLKTPPAVPTTSIYSRSDGVVAWQTCCHDRPSRRVQDIEVEGSHIGMGWNPKVLKIVGELLAQPRRRWRPYPAIEAALAGAA